MAEFSLVGALPSRDGGTIPHRHTCDGQDRSPLLSWSAPPAGSGSLALVLDNTDAPGGRFIHWLAWGITPDTGGLAEGEAAPLGGAQRGFRHGRLPRPMPAPRARTAPLPLLSSTP